MYGYSYSYSYGKIGDAVPIVSRFFISNQGNYFVSNQGNKFRGV